MTREDERGTVLPNALPRPKAPRPPLWAETGCLSSVVGAFVLALVVPWAALHYGFVYDGAPSLVGWTLATAAAIAVGAFLGAIIIPAVVLSGYWIIWRIGGRP